MPVPDNRGHFRLWERCREFRNCLLSLSTTEFRKHVEGRRRKVPDGNAIRDDRSILRAIWREEALLQA